jgi:zinc protease
MIPFLRLALVSGVGLGFITAAAAAPAPINDKVWVQTLSDVTPDPAVRFGRLGNGMRYAIQKNDTPAHQISIRLRIGSGSLEERDDQQGLAHFLEHMAFKGSAHVPEGEMVKLLERHGLAFGPDTNASTDFTETVFMLDLPESDHETLDLGLMLMRETAGELNLSQSAMNPERGVVLSEERLRDTPDYEALTKRLKFLLSGQLAPERFAIGKVDILKTAPVSLIRDYYAANYRPDRATLVVVGDVDPAALEAQIKTKFGDWKSVGPETAEPDYGEIAKRGPTTQLIVQAGARPSLSVAWVKPFDGAPESEAKDRRLEIEQIAIAVLDHRLEREARGDTPPFIGAGVNVGDELRSARITSLTVLPKPGEWKAALTAVLKTERQAVDFGVAQDEVDREIAQSRTRFQSEAAGAATRRTPDIAGELVRSVDELEVMTSPAQDLRRFDANVKGLTAAEVSQALKVIFSGQGPVLSLTTPDPIDGGAAALTAAFAAARTDPITAGAAEATRAWPYSSFGAPGQVASRREVADLGVTFVTFKNGVRLNIRPSALRKDQVLVSVRIGDGRLDLPKDRKTAIWAGSAVTLGGLGKISFEDTEQVLSSELYGAQFSVAENAMVLSGATRPADLDTQLQVLTAYTADPGFRPAAFQRVQNLLATQLDQLDATPQGVFGRDAGLLQHAGDLRWATPTQADVKAATLGELERLVKPVLASAPLEVDVTGDVKADTVIEAVAKTFGALPARPAPRPPAPAALALGFPVTGQAPVDLTHKGRADQAIAYLAWRSNGLFADPQQARAVNVAAQVVELRLTDRVRIAEGSTYSPSVSSNPSDVFPTYGLVAASVETPPARIDSFYKAVSEITADLRAKGPTADELERAVKPRIETLTKAQQTNEYWMTWLAGAEDDPRRLDIVRTTLPGYRRVTASDVQAAARAYLTDARAWKLEVTPKDAGPPPQNQSISAGPEKGR